MVSSSLVRSGFSTFCFSFTSMKPNFFSASTNSFLPSAVGMNASAPSSTVFSSRSSRS